MNKIDKLLDVEHVPSIAVDVDGTLTYNAHVPEFLDRTPNEMKRFYSKCKPRLDVIEWVNKKAEEGCLIYIITARDDLYQGVTIEWLKEQGVNYEYVLMKKPFYDLFIEDKAVRPEELFEDEERNES